MSAFSQGSLLGGSVHLFWWCQGLVSKAHAQKQRLAHKREVDVGRGCVPLRVQGTLRTLSVSLAVRPPRGAGGTQGPTFCGMPAHGPSLLTPWWTPSPPTHRCLLPSFPLSWGSPGARGRRRLPLPGGQLQAGPCGAGPALGRVSKSVAVVWYLPLLRSPHITRPKFRG